VEPQQNEVIVQSGYGNVQAQVHVPSSYDHAFVDAATTTNKAVRTAANEESVLTNAASHNATSHNAASHNAASQCRISDSVGVDRAQSASESETDNTISEKVLVLGLGNIGFPIYLSLAKKMEGDYLTGLDIDAKKIDILNSASNEKSTTFAEQVFHENENFSVFNNLLEVNYKMNFSLSAKDTIPNHSIIIVCVPTPTNDDATQNTKYIDLAFKSILENVTPETIVIVKSTILFSHFNKYEGLFAEKNCYLVHVPEFLREGKALYDILNQKSIIIGVTDSKIEPRLRDFYSKLYPAAELVFVRPTAASLIKYINNANAAYRIVFINNILEATRELGVDINDVIKGFGATQTLINFEFFYPGNSYGGPCLPKDTLVFSKILKQITGKDNIFESVHELNAQHNQDNIRRILDGISSFEHQTGKKVQTVSVLGLSFKPGTSDTMYSPALIYINSLLNQGYDVIGYDPMAEDTERMFAENGNASSYRQEADLNVAIENADAIIVCTEWPGILEHDFKNAKDSPVLFISMVNNKNKYKTQGQYSTFDINSDI
jgi:UDPglucose 6-dehydrogenase